MGERLIDRIVAKSPTDRRMIHVPEWEVDIYFKPLTRAQIDQAIPKDIERPVGTERLLVLAHMAEDADGKRLFRQTDVEKLRQHAEVTVLSRVEAFLWRTVTPTVEEAEEDLGKTPSLSGDSPSPAS